MASPAEPKFYVIENEIVSHDPFKHIGIQLLKFVTSFDEGKTSVRNFIMEHINKDISKLKKLEYGCSKSTCRNIDNYLDTCIYSDFRAIVVIDEARNELYNVLEKINANISVIELKTYVSYDNKIIHQFDSLYSEDEEEIKTLSDINNFNIEDLNRKRQKRLSIADTIIVPAREDGFNEVFLNENCWYEIKIGAAMKERIKFIAAYQTSPISAVTHIAEIKDIKPYRDSGKYIIYFKNEAKEIKPIKVKETNKAPQSPVYVEKEKLLTSKYLDDLF